jgi:hypothetical protein
LRHLRQRGRGAAGRLQSQLQRAEVGALQRTNSTSC